MGEGAAKRCWARLRECRTKSLLLSTLERVCARLEASMWEEIREAERAETENRHMHVSLVATEVNDGHFMPMSLRAGPQPICIRR